MKNIYNKTETSECIGESKPFISNISFVLAVLSLALIFIPPISFLLAVISLICGGVLLYKKKKNILLLIGNILSGFVLLIDILLLFQFFSIAPV